jgi:hypothetical protein
MSPPSITKFGSSAAALAKIGVGSFGTPVGPWKSVR